MSGSRTSTTPRLRYLAITPKHEQFTIRDADELYATMPVHAARLEGKLESSRQLEVTMVVSGRYESDRIAFSRADLAGECGEVTHIVNAFTTGAFELAAAAREGQAASAGVLGIGAGKSSERARELLNKDGEAEACNTSTRDDEPPLGCGALLRVELTPVRAAPNTSSVTAAPAPTASPPSAPPSERPRLLDVLRNTPRSAR